MKSAARSFFSVCLFGFFATGLSTAVQNRVLELDGKDSYVELPPSIFKDLDEVTVEGWGKCGNFDRHEGFYPRPFRFADLHMSLAALA